MSSPRFVVPCLDCRTFVYEAATEAELRRQASESDVLHFATHGVFPENDVIDFHYLLLAPDEGCDGRLRADELRSLDLSAAQLVALSICDGGIFRVGPGDEPYGLIPAVLTAGACNVLGTLWPLPDQVGRKHMVEFYLHLLSIGPAGALQQACLKLIRAGASLRDWAAFALAGAGRPFPA